MTAMTLKKGIAAFCCLLGVVLFLFGGYYLWSAPMEHGREGVISILAAFLLHAIFWVLWS
jgi:hypothetical protein